MKKILIWSITLALLPAVVNAQDIGAGGKTLIEFWHEVYDTAAAWFESEKFNLLVFCLGFVLTLVAVAAVNLLFRRVIVQKLAKKTTTQVDDIICDALNRPINLAVFISGIYLSAMPILQSMKAEAFDSAFRIFLAALTGTFAWAAYRMINVLDYLMKELAARSDNNLDDMMVNLVRKALKIIVASVAVLFIGQSILGINITTLLAGAGVCGLAVAFAAKETIANFFGSVMIILDKPFSVGQLVKSGDIDGIVESVGFRSTRIRTHQGHLLSVPNSKMADSVIENVSDRPNIKCVFNLPLVYDTAPEKIERAVAILHEVFDGFSGFNPEQPPVICFDSIKEWCMNINIAVWYQTTDWNLSRTWLQAHNLEILRRFNNEGIKLAVLPNSPGLNTGKK
jgi:MscS family membrane protein